MISQLQNKVVNLLEVSKLENYEIDIDKQNPYNRNEYLFLNHRLH